jgi:SAM-dependent methyltransferase
MSNEAAAPGNVVERLSMDLRTFKANYAAYIAELRKRLSVDAAMRAAVGTDFEANGILERELLKVAGLRPDHYLIDVGCGSGRLAVKLKDWLHGRYLGADVDRNLLAYAARIAARPDWRFELTAGRSIPEADGGADMVCFFSVFTHLLHEQSYVYLQEAKRVLRPGGRVVFSFLDFASAHLWPIFESNVRNLGCRTPLNMFISRDMIPVWATHLGLRVVDLIDGGTPYIPLTEPVRYDDGRVVEGCASFGQSICVLEKNGPAATGNEAPRQAGTPLRR